MFQSRFGKEGKSQEMERLRHALKSFSFISLFCLSLLQATNSDASHAMGADLTYTCLGGNTYRVTLSFYRDCIGISAPGSVYINVSSASCGENLGVTAFPIAGTGQEVTQLCPTAVSTCNGGVYTGIQEWIYEGVITLPRQCDDWLFSYSLCCRNAAITNIDNPGFSTFYLEAELDNLNFSCNNSPIFTNKPVPFACLGQQFCFNHGAYDPDGDSLVFSLIDPYQTSTTTVTYNGAFTASQPLSSTPPVSFNALTGDVCMTPTAMEVTVMAVLVQEYRNGILIGSVERDIQITVMNCNNTLPSLTGINGTNSFTDTICANEPYCFFINSIDPDTGQTVTITWDGGISGGTFTTTAGPRPDGNFCWTPTMAEIGNGPHCFTAKVSDDNCPMFGSQIYSYCLTVIGLDVDLGPDRSIACNDLATITATASGGTGNYSYLWSNGFTNPTQTLGVGTYVVTVDDGECIAMDTISVTNDAMPIAQFVANEPCVNTPVQFIDSSYVPFGIITNWSWTFGDGNTASVQNPVHTYNAAGNYTVTLIITTSLGCIDTVSHDISILPNPTASFLTADACVGASVGFLDTSTPPGSINFWNWNFGDGNTSNQQYPSHTYGSAGTYQVTLIAGDTSGCMDTVVQPVTIHPLPTANFSFNGSFCENNPINFTDLSVDANGIVSWYWTFGNDSTSTSQNPTVVFDTAGTYNVTLVVTNAFGCVDSITQQINIGIAPTITANPGVSVCNGDSAVLVATGNGTIVWTPGGTTGDTLV
ncbi:MAG: PKD domain-containing protein, partial [Bacteroidia bacterium]|nr:PKD domain-containing protein [Bacteroidia bacterium]